MNDLIKDIETLEKYMTDVDKQQLTFPIDVESEVAIRGDAFYAIGSSGPVSLASPYDDSSEVKIGDKKYLLDTTSFLDLGI